MTVSKAQTQNSSVPIMIGTKNSRVIESDIPMLDELFNAIDAMTLNDSLENLLTLITCHNSSDNMVADSEIYTLWVLHAFTRNLAIGRGENFKQKMI